MRHLGPLVLVTISVLVSASAEPPSTGRHYGAMDGESPGHSMQPLSGPNVCQNRHRKFCCRGWTLQPRSRLCIIPVCSKPCPGYCVAPDECQCKDDAGKSAACSGGRVDHGGNGNTQLRQRDRTCRKMCMYGGTCIGDRCVCALGYSGEFCNEPVCVKPCLNGGRCHSPDRCSCVYGFTGANCENDHRTGPCYTGIKGALCTNQLYGVVCTKNLCCASVGKAWGHPCEHCPTHMECEHGYLKNIRSGECVDIDECEAIPGLCEGGKCVNSIGSFTCECAEGKARNPDTNRCEDRDECQDKDICRDGRCVNTDPGFYCVCNPGFIQSQDRTFCIDGRQGHCFTERTKSGYCRYPLAKRLSKKDCCCGMNMGKGWGDDCMECPIHGTDEHKYLCKGIIRITDTVTKDGDQKKPDSLIRINECILRPGICGPGECIDTAEGYECRCNPGYRLRQRDHVCEDIDECREGKCQGGHCTNSPGSFTCVCPPGFDVSPDGTRCTDHDECAEIGMCTNGICINMDGSYKCQCKSGFKLSPTGRACVDIDECYENPRICINGQCDNVPGSYACICQPGFTISNDRTYCIDLDECSNTGMCGNGKCVNIEGSFRCVCDSGYRSGPDGKHCMDIDECLSNPCQHGKCYNSPGSFRCECHPGFNIGPDGRSCLDSRRDLCYSQYRDGQCFNPTTIAVTKSSCCCCTIIFGQPMGWGTNCQACPLPGTSEFELLCPHGPGMTYNGDDINECAQNPSICQNGACENMIGTHRCICNPGYEVDETGKICTDINECELEDMVCSGGQCRNTPGSFQCICPSGTQLNPRNHVCEDIDECNELGPETCFKGECVNTFGSYKCECDPGSILDNTGRMCIDNKRGSCWTRMVHGRCENNLPKLSLRSECCCSIGRAWGSPCETCNQHECDCPKGYAKIDGKTCTDVNECDLNPEICRGGGTCVNTDGSFTCSCPAGLTLDTTKTLCLDVRQEQCFTRYKHGQCTNPLDGLYNKNLCCCSPVGKAWGGDRCEPCPRPGTATFAELCPKGGGFLDRKDINECTEFPGMCGNGRCKNSIGSYNCKCNKGYALDEFKIKCIDIDECKIMHGVCGNGICRNIPGDFVCDCNEGYRTMNMMQVCMDINECEETPGLCRGGRCINTDGSFKCVCPPGHELAPDKQSCKDIDECSRTSGICSNGVCENLMGTYQCICDDGYQQTGLKSHCEDIDECEDDNGGCEDVCMNTPGSFSCACGLGYSLLLDGRTCVDVDECHENTRICNGGKCVNTPGSYMCHCTDGLISGPGSTTCLDVDECARSRDICGNGDCVNTLGSFQCRCEDGYSVKPEEGPACSDDDECFLGNYNCHVNADCINNPGSYQCRCHDGFTGNGITCRDINECLTNNGGCHQNAQCINTDGSFKCVCDTGFKGDGYSCIDIDECSNDPTLCENGQCLNYPGAFRCECEMGFMHPDETNDQSCIDINECRMFTNLCVFGRCENIFGMFRCECHDGYTLDGTGGNCTDIDECKSPQSCLYGKCSNKQGSHVCECPPHYEIVPAGNACIDRRKSRCYLALDSRGQCHADTSDYVTKASCCCSVGQAWGPHCELCPKRDTPEYEELCPGGMGYRPNEITVVLEDINECDEHENLCKNGHCTNTFGSFMCSCQEGFRLDETGAMCEDVDECQEIPGICKIGTCVNEEGRYHCVCPEGYMPMPGGKECVDMRKDVCYLHFNHYGCSTPMSQNTTKKLCCCSMGQGWGHPCRPCPTQGTKQYYLLCGQRPGQIMNPMTNETEEIDECELMPSMCSHGQCVNTPGSFECQCNRGYIYDVNSHQCIDDNECLKIPSPCQGNAQCINLPGYFECKCPEGYKHGLSQRDCVDIDECTEQPNICQNGVCKNLQGSFQCICQTGYLLTPGRDTCLDVDECSRHPNMCNNGTCVNMVGSYKCHCYPGFKLSPNNDCVDIDECHMMPYLCRNGRCRNTIGSFVCECTSGYILSADKQHCRDIDECIEEPNFCPSPGKCQNRLGSYICSCPDGYELSDVTHVCEDTDECREHPGICENGVCTNTQGGAFCTCPEGFRLSQTHTAMKCIDVRQEMCYDKFFRGQCTSPRGMSIMMKECCCSKGAAWGRYCQECPREGSPEFAKLCPEGPGRMETGEDLNECHFMPDACSGGDCINTDGSFRCECPMGYVLDPTGRKCVDDNECLTAQNICGNGTCTNVDGGFECSCNDGFTPGPMQICEDINECLEIGHQCAFRCHNVPGSYRCICPYGYALAPDGKHCLDVDECVTPANNCKFQCKNLIGTFMCVCPEGYTQIGMTDDCRDVNECAINSGLCQNGRCMNLQGSYRCDCYEGFEPSHDRKTCIDRRLGFCFRQLVHGRCPTQTHDMIRVDRQSCCCTMGEAWGPHCEICPPKYSDEYQQMCLERGISVDGQDIDECAAMPDLCRNGRCINTLGSYRCICNKGYKPEPTGTYCSDINECQQSPSPCKFSCQNTEGSFICSCPSGYILNPDGVSCRDIDECAIGSHICQHECINTQGSYKCGCEKGYNQVGDKCLDINECTEEEGICPKPGKCINTLGSFKCICPRGFKLDATKSFCLDADECLDDGKCTQGCQNLVGGYRCGCPEGYTKHYYYNQCVDEDECMSSPCGSAGNCINTRGSYRCGCPEGYQYDNGLQICIQVSAGCVNAPCVFGCTSLGSSGFSCDCPQGYQHIGQGHCLSTISPLGSGGYGQDIGNVPVYPIDGDYKNNDKVITNEGCFSCKINGRHRRDSKHRANVSPKTNHYEEVIHRLLKRSPLRHHKRRHHHGEELVMTISLSQTKHRMRIIKIQSSVKRDMEYTIARGNETNKFELIKKHGVWALHFKRRLKHHGAFDIVIHGRPGVNATDAQNETYEKPLTLRVRLVVTE